MYWPEHWDKGLNVPRTPSGGNADKGDGLLDAVIDKTGKNSTPKRKVRPVYAEFPSKAVESRFKSCLSRVPVECRMERNGSKRILALRPKNVQRFDELVRTSGLGNCEAAMKAVQWLRANPSEFIRFETH
jgi:hypothetical protein